MKKFIVLSLLICLLTGCLTPYAFRETHGKKSGRYTTYRVTDYKNGFRVDMTYYKFDAAGTGVQTTFEARNKLKNLAEWIAEARKRKIRPLKTEDIHSSHYHNTATQHTHWRGDIRVHYIKK